ncbi:MAG TPA: ribosome silencing factor [Terriglobales bacterium]|nr:ribosome silencing factor [Terriglobales bacterium]
MAATKKTEAAKTDLKLRRQLRMAAQAAMDKKALDPVLLDLRKVADFCDYFLICHGANPAQIRTIADNVEERLDQQQSLQPAHREGGRDGEWIVLDYLHFIVHIFSSKSRRFYDLERLWGGAPKLALPTSAKSE